MASDVFHPFPPVFCESSSVLILGSFPSVRSRGEGFYYGHPRNRFWRVIAGIFGEDEPFGNEARRDFLLIHRIALWDVVASCEIEGSADSSISRAAANDIGIILDRADIKAVFTNGAAAHRLYRKLIFPEYAVEDVPLPSTSPANARISEAQLTARWMCVRDAVMGI